MKTIQETLELKTLKKAFNKSLKRIAKSDIMLVKDEKTEEKLLNKIEELFEKYKDTTKYEEFSSIVSNEIATEIDEASSGWSYVATAVSKEIIHKGIEESTRKYLSLEEGYTPYEWMSKMVDKNLIDKTLLDSYSKDEINKAYGMINNKKDLIFTFIGYHTMLERYCLKSYKNDLLETPQMRWITIALTIHKQEDKSKRMKLIEETYWALSNLYMTVATPTLANAGKPNAQLSSCFIDTVEDSLDGIYNSNTDVANLSKHGGGIGVYMGKVRARGSDIRGFEGVSSGISDYSPLTL